MKHDNKAALEDRYDSQQQPGVAGNHQQRTAGVDDAYGANPAAQSTYPPTQQGLNQSHPNKYNAVRFFSTLPQWHAH